MTVDVSLSTQGHIPIADIRDALEGIGAGPVTFEVTEYDDPAMGMARRAKFVLRDPTDRRNQREVYMHHGMEPDDEEMTHVTGDEYSYFRMGAHAGGPTVMRALAERYGGLYMNDETEEEVLLPYPGAPKP